ncbi:MAG: hypothetical protein M3N33_06645 [Actinomycetota bacterium]|nr:hypothetical protein [Actinomycetota bacterium]
MMRSRNLTVGLVLSAILAALDIFGLAGFGSDDGPPAGVMIAGAVLGVITFAGVRMAWRDGRNGVPMIIGSRVLSALLGLPVFFIDDVPRSAPVVVGISIAVTAVAVGLILGARRAAGSPHATA